MACEIEWIGKSIHWKFQGEMTGEQIIETFSQLYGQERFDDTRGQIRNYTESND